VLSFFRLKSIVFTRMAKQGIGELSPFGRLETETEKKRALLPPTGWAGLSK
jgi:hypothetical protein